MKLVGSRSQGRSAGGYLALKAVVLKGQGEGVRRVHLPLDPLPVVRTPSTQGTSGGAGTILLQTPLEGSKSVGLLTVLPSTTSRWGSRDD